MADKAVAKNTDDAVTTDKKLDDLYDLIDGIEIAMLTRAAPTAIWYHGQCRRRSARQAWISGS